METRKTKRLHNDVNSMFPLVGFSSLSHRMINAEPSGKRHTELLTMNIREDWAGRGEKMSMRVFKCLLPQSVYFPLFIISMYYFLNEKYF